MKKISLFLVALATVLGLTSCEDEKKPKFQQASSDSFEVYEPAFANQYYELTSNGTFEITCKSAPDYGAPIGPTVYGAQVSLDPSFSNPVEITAENSASKIMFKDQDLAQAICLCMGLTKEDVGYVFTSTKTVYIKPTCQISAIPNSKVVAKNYCTLKNVMPYFAIPSPAFIYLVGAPEGWSGPSAGNAAHYEDWKLFEKDDEIGSNVYYGSFQVNQGDAMFRFYTSLTNWDTDSYGSQSDDNPLEFSLDDKNSYAGKIVPGKGSFSFPDWPGGVMEICVNLDKNTISVSLAE